MSKNRESDKNYEKNMMNVGNLVTNELNYEDKRHENIHKKASTYLGFVSLLILLLFKFNDGSLLDIKEKQIIIPFTYFIYIGFTLFFVSIIFSLFSLKPRDFKRPNLSTKENGLLYKKDMEKSDSYYNRLILANLTDILNTNIKQNNKSAKWILHAFYTFSIAIILISLTLIIGGLYG